MIKPLVSVIIPTHNRSFLVKRAIRSVLNQTYSNFECIVIDDSSLDNTNQIIKSFEDERIKYLVHKKNKGASAARNTGISHSNGKFIAFLDDDDEWLETKLEKQMNLIINLPKNVGMVYCWMDYFNENENIIYQHHPTLRGEVLSELLDAQKLGGCPTLLVRSEVINKIGNFDERLKRGNDGDFIRRVCKEYEVDYFPEVLVKVYENHGKKRISDNDKQGIRNHIESILSRFNKFKSIIDEFPEQRTNILIELSHSYLKLGNFNKSIYYYFKSFTTNPYSISFKRNFKIYVKSILVLLFK